jgi:hypothetical protein
VGLRNVLLWGELLKVRSTNLRNAICEFQKRDLQIWKVRSANLRNAICEFQKCDLRIWEVPSADFRIAICKFEKCDLRVSEVRSANLRSAICEFQKCDLRIWEVGLQIEISLEMVTSHFNEEIEMNLDHMSLSAFFPIWSWLKTLLTKKSEYQYWHKLVSVEFQSFCRENVAWPVYESVMRFLCVIVRFLRLDPPAKCEEKFHTASLVKTTTAMTISVIHWISQSFNEYRNQSVNISITQSLHECLKHSITQWMSQSLNDWMNVWISQSLNEYLHHSMNISISEW